MAGKRFGAGRRRLRMGESRNEVLSLLRGARRRMKEPISGSVDWRNRSEYSAFTAHQAEHVSMAKLNAPLVAN